VCEVRHVGHRRGIHVVVHHPVLARHGHARADLDPSRVVDSHISPRRSRREEWDLGGTGHAAGTVEVRVISVGKLQRVLGGAGHSHGLLDVELGGGEDVDVDVDFDVVVIVVVELHGPVGVELVAEAVVSIIGKESLSGGAVDSSSLKIGHASKTDSSSSYDGEGAAARGLVVNASSYAAPTEELNMSSSFCGAVEEEVMVPSNWSNSEAKEEVATTTRQRLGQAKLHVHHLVENCCIAARDKNGRKQSINIKTITVFIFFYQKQNRKW
jgi:hypothetical protein